MRRSLVLAHLALLALIALPASASAAPAKLSPQASAVSAAGAMTVQAANPNGYVMRGAATVTAGKRVVATRAVRLGSRSVATIRLRFDAGALSALRATGGRATIALRLRRAGGRATTARRTYTLRLVSGAPSGDAPAPAPGGDAPAPSKPGAESPAPAPPASDRWVGRMGAEGAYDDLELTVVGGQMQITKAPVVPVYCFVGGGSASALSLELFDAPGPWSVGTDGSVAKQGVAVNELVGSSPRTITYKVTNSAQQSGRLTGTLGMSYFDSKYDVFTYSTIFINCSGSQSFEAVPAG